MSMRRALALVLALALFGLPATAAEPARSVPGPTVTLGEVVPNAPDDLAGIDLGDAPPAGGSRLISRDEMRRAIERAGGKASDVALPQVVRITVASKTWSPDELANAAKPVLAQGLPPGITVERLRVRRALTAPERARIESVKLPRYRKRAGLVTTSGTIELSVDGHVVARAPVAVYLRLTERAAEPTVQRGGRIELVIERGSARVTAIAEALADTDVDEVGRFRVVSTRKILSARVESARVARVTGGS